MIFLVEIRNNWGQILESSQASRAWPRLVNALETETTKETGTRFLNYAALV